MRIRYIISRWGYSPEISVLELFSEANNIGNHAHLVPGNGGGCNNAGSNLVDPYYDDVNQPMRVYDWQNKICRYIKEDLHHTQHPLGTNYTGHPVYEDPNTQAGCNIVRGDSSYYSPYTDFWTWNNYTYSPDRFSLNHLHNIRLNANGNQEVSNSPPNINKPVMYSEIGLAGGNCDYDLTWRQVIARSPFDGSSGGLCYDRNNNFTTAANIDERNDLWKTYGYVNDFIKGVALDDDDWYFYYDDRADHKADVVYLSRRLPFKAAMGAIQNKTVNFYTGRNTSLGLGDDCYTYGLTLDAVYQTAETVTQGLFGNRLIVTNMEPKTEYLVEWYNPFTGQYLGPSFTKTSNSGDLELEFWDLKGEGLSSVVLFKAYPIDEPSFQPERDGLTELSGKDYLLRDFSIDSQEVSLENMRSSYETSQNSVNNGILVVPNPNKGIFNVFFEGNADVLTITNSIGKLITTVTNPESGLQFNLSTLSSGVYLVKTFGKETNYIYKFIVK